MKKNKSIYILPALIAVLCFFAGGCVSAPEAENEISFASVSDFNTASLSWKKINSFAEYCVFSVEKPDTRCHLLKINLKSRDIKITSFPHRTCENQEKKSQIKARDFAKKSGAQILFNTTQFSQKVKGISKKNPVGLVVDGINQISEPKEKYACIAFYCDDGGYYGRIISSQKNYMEKLELKDKQKNLVLIHGGFFKILEGGEVIQFKDIKDTRIGAGLSKDGRILFVLAAEGEKISQDGLSYGDCAFIFKDSGAYEALEFDGGSSAVLYIDGKNAFSYEKNPELPCFIGFLQEKE